MDFNYGWRVVVLVVLCLATPILVLLTGNWIFSIPGILLILIAAIDLHRLLNRTRRDLTYFFDAIRNEDSSLLFPVKTGSHTGDLLHESMNRLNRLISESRQKNRIQEQYYETILEHAAAGLLTVDEQGHVLMSNTAARRLLGCDPLTHLKQLDRIAPGLSSDLAGIPQNGKKLLQIQHERGRRQLSVRTTTMGINQKKLSIYSIQDIHHELDEKETESWIRLIRVLTHEIMNSIAPITSLSETMAGYFEHASGPKPVEDIDNQVIANTIKGLSVIRERGKGLINFVDSYRKLTHLPEPRLTITDVQQFLENVRLLVLPDLTSRNIQLQVELQEQGLHVLADENMLLQVILNLVRNSCDALEGRHDARIRLAACRTENDQIRLEVEDNGPGIPPELLDKIFVPFFTTREQGSGIGLSLSRQIMRLHGGNISVNSRPGHTIFELTVMEKRNL